MKSACKMLACGVALACLQSPTWAQSGSGTGVNSDLLMKAIRGVMRGECRKDLMSPMLQGTCEMQVAQMSKALSQRGDLSKAEFMGTQPTAMGPAEVYRVYFNDAPMMWMINTGPDGKIVVFWTPG